MEIARNLQQQVEYLTEELNKLKQSLGSALPDPIAGPTGPTGPTGATGEKGETGNGIIGYGTTLPLGGRNGDFFFLKTANDVVLYKKNNFGSWLAQTSIRGPQGPIAEPEQQIVANPEGTPTDYISTIDIDGVIYRSFLDAEEIQLVNTLNETISIDDSKNVEFVHDVTIDGELKLSEDSISYGDGNTIYLSDISTKLYKHKLKLITLYREINVELFSTDFEEINGISYERNLISLFGYWDNGNISSPIYKIWFEDIGNDTHVHFTDGNIYYDEIINRVVDTVVEL